MKRLVFGIVLASAFSIVGQFPTSPSHAQPLENSQSQTSPTATPTPYDIVATARQYIGSRYAMYGDTPSEGFSCLGFVVFVFHQLGVYVPYDMNGAWNSAPHVAQNDLMPGDILFFSNTVYAGLSHVAIYIGNGQMIGADNFSVGVTIDNIYSSYWAAHYAGATRPLALLHTVPMPVQANQGNATPAAAVSDATLPVGSMVQPVSGQVDLYSGPGYQYTPLSTLNPAIPLSIIRVVGGWYNVRVGATSGWVSVSSVRAAISPAVKQHLAARATDLGQSVRATLNTSAQGVDLLFARENAQVGSGVQLWTRITLLSSTVGRTSAVHLGTGW